MRIPVATVIALAACACIAAVVEMDAPPMGWSTWDALGLDINETVILEVGFAACTYNIK